MTNEKNISHMRIAWITRESHESHENHMNHTRITWITWESREPSWRICISFFPIFSFIYLLFSCSSSELGGQPAQVQPLRPAQRPGGGVQQGPGRHARGAAAHRHAAGLSVELLPSIFMNIKNRTSHVCWHRIIIFSNKALSQRVYPRYWLLYFVFVSCLHTVLTGIYGW